MLSVLFCDDDPFFLHLIRPVSDEICSAKKLPARCIGAVSRGEEALQLRQNHPGPCAVFLDLDFGAGKLCGIDIARQLRSFPDTHVIYLTNYAERAMEILQSGTEPYGFLEKSTDFLRLSASLCRYLCMLTRELPSVEKAALPLVHLQVGGESLTIPARDILYLEAEKRISHGITYHTAGGSVLTVISTMETELQRLGHGFRQVHRSYIVQNAHVAALRKGELVLSDGTCIPCSPARRKEVKTWLTEN